MPHFDDRGPRRMFPRVQQMVRSRLRSIRPGVHHPKGGNPNGPPTGAEILARIPAVAGPIQPRFIVGEKVPFAIGEPSHYRGAFPGAGEILARIPDDQRSLVADRVPFALSEPGHRRGQFPGAEEIFARIPAVAGRAAVQPRALVAGRVPFGIFEPSHNGGKLQSPSQFIQVEPPSAAQEPREFTRRISGVLG